MPLLPISGLYAIAASKQRQAADLAAGAQERCTPVETFEMESKAKALVAEANLHEQHATSNENLVANIEQLIHYLVHSPHKSAERTLALRKLEAASGILRRECGDAVETIINGKYHTHG
jgi:hypothetical protein